MATEYKYDVFISYSRKDYVDEHKNVIPGNEVSKIKEALTEAGITYWFDEKGIFHGDEFAGVIADAIDESSLFVFISSENSNDSTWTLGEIATAQEANKKIIPVRIDSARYHKSLRVRLNALDYIDYKTNPEKGRLELVQSINAYLEEVKANEAQKLDDEKRKMEELEFQRKLQEEEKKRQEKIAKIEKEIAALETLKTEREKAVLLKEQELKSAQVDLKVCEDKIQKLQNKLQELHEPPISKQKKLEEERKAAEEERLAEKERKRRDDEEHAKEKVFPVGGISFKMIRVEGGDMGTFYIGETQVTQALWQAVMGDNPSFFNGQDCPVDCVKWYDICGEDGTGTDPNCFLFKLNQKTRKQFRLPKESEWEYAARGGNISKGYTYAGSDNIDEVAWYSENSKRSTHPVNEKFPNELGIYDMSGNVWEWCEDFYKSSTNHVLRGGSWNDSARFCCVSSRNYGSPDDPDNSFGFRLVLPQ